MLTGFVLLLHARSLRQEAIQDLPRNLDVALDIAQTEITGWAAGRESHASMLAQLFAETARPTGTKVGVERGVEFDEQHLRFLRAVTNAERYAGVWVYADSGVLLGSVSAAASVSAPLPVVAREGRTRAIGIRSGVHSNATPLSLEFLATAAPAHVDSQHGGTTVVIRTVPGDETFSTLNPTSNVNRSARTSLLVHAGDSVFVVATRSHSGNANVKRAFAWSEVPPFVKAVLNGKKARGVGSGLIGREVAYSAQPTLARDWGLIREIEVDEFQQRLTAPLATQAVLLFALITLLMFAIVNRTRAALGRRERELSRLRTEFVASASHELRTPLAQIQLFSELLRAGSLPSAPDRERALHVISSESQRLSTLVDNLLSFAALRRGATDGHSEVCDIADETAQVLSDFAALAAERNVDVVAQLEQPTMARIGSEAYRQIVINFLDNAVKYGPYGQTITVRVSSSHRHATLIVEDEGPGVPLEERERIWQAFYRRPSAAASEEEGSGLGLAVVRDLVLQYGGASYAESTSSSGARFVVHLPRVTA